MPALGWIQCLHLFGSVYSCSCQKSFDECHLLLPHFQRINLGSFSKAEVTHIVTPCLSSLLHFSLISSVGMVIALSRHCIPLEASLIHPVLVAQARLAALLISYS